MILPRLSSELPDSIQCGDCGEAIDLKPVKSPGFVGALPFMVTDEETYVCDPCGGVRTLKYMHMMGRVTLYLTRSPGGQWVVSGFAGTPTFHPGRVKKGKHNMARNGRYDVWFVDNHGMHWHGVNVGDNQILRCRRLKKQP